MLTRCPRCDTVFRITTEQLRARGGKVRCGHCRTVFNALESLIEEPPPVPPPTEAKAPTIPAPESIAIPVPAATPPAPAIPVSAPPSEPVFEPAPEPVPETPPVLDLDLGQEAAPEAPSEPIAELDLEEPTIPFADEPQESEQPPLTPESENQASNETPEESTHAAREAGLVAARELAEAPGYSRWAAGTLAGASLTELESEARQPPRWPFVVVALLLFLGLTAQLSYHFRTDLVQRLPHLGAVFTALDIDVPLPRQPNLVSIEASDLQSDPGRGMLVLQATLKNRAAFDQAWPALELTLTDTFDGIVARRVIEAPDYLPPKADTKVFAANSETAVRLWIEAKEVTAAGYRLYVFYP